MNRYEKEINEMTIEKLAGYMINTHMIDNGWYDYNDEWEEWYEEVYESPAEEGYYYRDKEDCIDRTVEWLKEEF